MMHNNKLYSFEKTEVRGRFLLKFSCTNVKLETVSPIAANGLQLPEGREFENEITLKN
jgi:hypothetical protein